MKARITITLFATLALFTLSSGGALSASTARAPSSYTVVDLGEGDIPSAIAARFPDNTINKRGQRVGTAGGRAVVWENGIMTVLAELPNTYGASGATAINNRGQIVGYDPVRSAFGGRPEVQPVIWDKGTVTNLGSLPGDSGGQAGGINQQGQIAGTSISRFGSGGIDSRAVVWDKGTITPLGRLPGYYESEAGAINNRGEVLGNVYMYSRNTGPQATRAVLWQPNYSQSDGVGQAEP